MKLGDITSEMVLKEQDKCPVQIAYLKKYFPEYLL